MSRVKVTKSRAVAIVVIAVGISLSGGELSYASPGRSGDAITACENVKTGALRLESKKLPCVKKGPTSRRERRVA
jgi:hypothetical protein